MSLATGTRVGPYEILSPLGVGGMGEVYRARDPKLNRDVAIKVLLPAVANDPDRLARFSREAQVLASLNHPNIAAIYGVEESGGVTALVMELVDGEDLSQRISRGAIPLDEALPIARQIAEALEAAHEQGIIHRALKPANIKVRSDGTVKVLDFGLAKAMDAVPGGRNFSSADHADPANSPTLSIHATEAGLILGTAAYMSPEQARGHAVDRRADVWAFGVVLFEMLSGRRPFGGETLSDTLASVLKTEPPWDAIPAAVPKAIRRLLTICLTKDARTRLRDMGEARRQIDETLAAVDAPESMVATMSTPNWRRVLPWAITAGLSVALVAMFLLWAPRRVVPSSPSRVLLTHLGAGASLPTEQGASAILSPDGTTLVFTGVADQRRLFVRKLDQLQATALVGTEGALNPFFSPDGQWVAFFASGKLKRVSVAGGAAVTLCSAPDNRGGTWSEDDTIIFAPARTTLERVSSAGGVSAPLEKLGDAGVAQRWPQALPGGKAVLYSERLSGGRPFDDANLVVAAIGGGTPKIVVRGGYYGRYLPSGHLVYMQQGTLFAVAFDLTRLETVGRAVPALENLIANPSTGGAQFSFSSDGTLVYLPGKAFTGDRPIDWVGRDGKSQVLRAAVSDWRAPRFSPDGQKLAFTITDGKQRDIWVYQLAGDTLTQLTFDPGDDDLPAWTPDGRQITFTSDRATAGTPNLYSVNADGTGAVTRLSDAAEPHNSGSWHPSGAFFVFSAFRAATGLDLLILPMAGDAARGWTPNRPTEFLHTSFNESEPTFSPDGRWIAYSSNESGQIDVYVRPFPGAGGPWRISTEGGQYPRWSAAANELLFLDGVKVMVATYSAAGDSFQADKPQAWTPTALVATGASPYDLHPDGKRIATTAAFDDGRQHQDQVVFFLNFFDHLRKIAPVAKP